jgi:cytochrome P450
MLSTLRKTRGNRSGLCWGAYFRSAIQEQRDALAMGLIQAMMTAEVDGSKLCEEEIVANLIVTMVGGQETTTNLIGNGLLTLLRNPSEIERLRSDSSLITSAVGELLRYESPSQHTARLAPEDVEMGGKHIRKRQAVIAVMGAANRDPERFPDPDRLDLTPDNRHVAFGWAAYFCFGAHWQGSKVRSIAFETLLRRLPNLALEPNKATQFRSARFDRVAREFLTTAQLSHAKRRLLTKHLQERWKADLQRRRFLGAH